MLLRTLALATLLSAPLAAAPTVGAIIKNADPVGQYRKFELSFPVTTWASNLYDPAQIDVHVTFTSPAGQAYVINAFPYQAYIRSGSTAGQTLSPTGALVWKCRFAPPAQGAWTYVLSAIDTGGAAAPISGSFSVTASASHGFIRVSPNDPHYFNYSDGTAVFPVGENFAWADSKDDNTYCYDDHLAKLSAQGASLVRIWMASWSFGIEGSDTGLGDYSKRQDRAWALDYVMDQLDKRGMLAQLTLENHIPYSAANGWGDNPYNAALGGPLTTPDQLWTNATAQAYYSRRWRYITARWGYSTALFGYEFFNEIENTDNYAAHWPDIAAWHATNAAVMRADSPQTHPFSTSFGYYISGQEQVWPALDYTQFHEYNAQDMAGMMQARVPQMRGYLNGPCFAGEFGTDWDWTHASLLTNDVPGWNLASAAWGSLMTGAATGGLTWWWDNLVDGENQYPRYRGVSAFVAGEDLDRHHYQPQMPAVGNAQGQPLRAYVLNGADKALGWVQNSNHEWYAIQQGWAINSVNGATVALSGLSVNGSWTLEWWDTNAGVWASGQTVTVSGGAVTLTVPTLDGTHPDWAFKLYPAPPAPQASWRINAGGPAYTDALGHAWSADTQFSGGSTASAANAIAGTADPALYQTERWGAFTYSLPVPVGSYQLTLKFAETKFTAAGSRIFNVLVNGAPVLANFDIVAAGGANTAVDAVINNLQPNAQGFIIIQFGPASVDNAKVDAIEIIPQPLSPTPTRSATPSPTVAKSPSATASPTARATASGTSTATAPTPQASPTAAPVTASATPTAAINETATASATASATGSPSSTSSMTPTGTLSASLTASATPTATASPSATPTPSPTPSTTLSALTSPTPSPPPTPAPSATPASSPTAGAASPSPTVTAMPSATVSVTPTPSDTAVPALTAGPSLGVAAGRGPLRVDQALPYPNPDPNALGVRLAGPADRVEIRIYSAAEVRVASAVAGACQAGWVQVSLPAGWSRGLPRGVYYARVLAYRGAAVSPPAKPARLVLLN